MLYEEGMKYQFVILISLVMIIIGFYLGRIFTKWQKKKKTKKEAYFDYL